MSSPNDPIEKDQDLEMLQKHVDAIGEHFDTVQIFASRHEGLADQTESFAAGSGNSFARFGQIYMWLEAETERLSPPIL